MGKIVIAFPNKVDLATIKVAQWQSVLPDPAECRKRGIEQIATDLMKRYPVITAYLATH